MLSTERPLFVLKTLQEPAHANHANPDQKVQDNDRHVNNLVLYVVFIYY